MRDPLINEFVANHVGADTSEYLEIKGDASADYSGWTLVQIEGDAGGTTGRVISATAIGSTDAEGYWSSGFQSNLLQNGSGTLLLVENYTGSTGQDLDTNDDGVLDATPWGRIGDGIAIDDGGAGDRFYTGTVLTPGFDGGSQAVGGASRLPDGVDTDRPADWVRNDFDLAGLPGQAGTPVPGEALNTPGAVNAPVGVSTPDFHAIYDIQGAGHRSEFEGDRVATRGVVTAIAANGFYIQDAQGDGNSATSDAVFVFTGGTGIPAEVQLGVTLDITGSVSEFQPGGASGHNLTITEITGATVEVSAEQQTVPVAVNIGAGGYAPPTEAIDDDGRTVFDPSHDGVDYWESLEGMVVDVPAPVVVGPTNGFGEIYVLADRGDHATGTQTGAGGILISETDQQPERIQIDDDLLGGSGMPHVNVGADLGTIHGVVSYNFGWYEVQAIQPLTVESPGALTPETTVLAGDRDHLTIGSINLENLDPKVEDINLVDGKNPNNVDDDIGSGKFDRLAAQIVDNMKAPDIVALQEVQDSNGAEVTGVTSAAETARVLIESIVAHGGPRYEYVDVAPANGTSGGQPGGNIRVGYLYNPERVDLVEGSVHALTDPDLSDGDAFAASRLPLAADFSFNGEIVTVVNNHFTSKSGSSPTYGEDFPPLNRGEDQREAQAAIVNAYVDGRLAADPDAKVMVVGDLNEFSWNDPLKVLHGDPDNPVLKDLADELLPPGERWSYVFEGASQELDHMLATKGAYDAGLQFDIVHTNSGFADQVSDHDPSVARLHLPAPGTPENPHVIVADKPNFFFNFATVKGTDAFDEVRASVNLKAGDGVERIVLQGDHDLIVWAGKTDTQITGNSGNNILYGGAGRDTIAGGHGDDLLIGGRGGDSFAFGRGDGHDTIADFDVRQDRLDIADGVPFTVKGSLLGAVVELDDGSRITLLGVRPDQVDHADWLV